jgi:hypothetical protein
MGKRKGGSMKVRKCIKGSGRAYRDAQRQSCSEEVQEIEELREARL